MIHKRGKFYGYDFHHKGRRYRGSTGQSKRSKAQEFHDDLYEKIRRQWKGLAEVGNREIDCREIFEMYLEMKKYEWAESTWKSHDWDIRADFMPHFGGTPVIALTKSMVNKFIAKQRSRNIKGSTINLKLGRLRAILNWAVAQELTAANPMRFEKVREAEKKEPIILDAELEQIYMGGSDFFPAFNEMVFIGRHTGLRVGNIALLTWSQLNLAEREKASITIRAERMKGRRTISLPLIEEVVDRLREINKMRRLHSDYVFSKKDGKPYTTNHVTNVFTRICQSFGMEYTFHHLRHTFASYYIINGGDLYILAKLLGHKTLTQVERYAHLNIEHLRKAVKNSPRTKITIPTKQ